MEWKPTLQGTYGPNMNAFWWVAVEIWTFEKLAYKTLSQCDRNVDVDDRGDYNSSPCTSYRPAKKGQRMTNSKIFETPFLIRGIKILFPHI